MISLPARVVVPKVHTKFDQENEPSDERFKESVERMTLELLWYAEALQNQKTAMGVPK